MVERYTRINSFQKELGFINILLYTLYSKNSVKLDVRLFHKSLTL